MDFAINELAQMYPSYISNKQWCETASTTQKTFKAKICFN